MLGCTQLRDCGAPLIRLVFPIFVAGDTHSLLACQFIVRNEDVLVKF